MYIGNVKHNIIKCSIYRSNYITIIALLKFISKCNNLVPKGQNYIHQLNKLDLLI